MRLTHCISQIVPLRPLVATFHLRTSHVCAVHVHMAHVHCCPLQSSCHLDSTPKSAVKGLRKANAQLGKISMAKSSSRHQIEKQSSQLRAASSRRQ